MIHVSSRLADSSFKNLFIWGCAGTLLLPADYSLVAVSGLLTVVGSLAVEHGLWSTRASVIEAPGHEGAGPMVVMHGLRCSPACEIVPGLGSNLCLLHWQADSSPLDDQGSPSTFFLLCNKGCILHESWFQGRSPSYADCSHDFSQPVNKDMVILGPFSSFMHRSGLQHLWQSCIYLLNFLATSRHARICVLWPGTEPMPPVVEAYGVNHWTTREVPILALNL